MNGRRIVVACCGIGMSERYPLALRSLRPPSFRMCTQVERETSMIDFVFLASVIFAAVYWLTAFASVVLYRRRRPSTSDVAPPVTILKPLRGNDAQLYQNLRSFCLQDYRCFENRLRHAAPSRSRRGRRRAPQPCGSRAL